MHLQQKSSLCSSALCSVFCSMKFHIIFLKKMSFPFYVKLVSSKQTKEHIRFQAHTKSICNVMLSCQQRVLKSHVVVFLQYGHGCVYNSKPFGVCFWTDGWMKEFDVTLMQYILALWQSLQLAVEKKKKIEMAQLTSTMG